MEQWLPIGTSVLLFLTIVYFNRSLSDKIDALRLELKGDNARHQDDIKDVRNASESAHREIRNDLAEIKAQQAAHSERFRCIETRLEMSRQDET